MIRRERRGLRESRLTFKRLEGAEITAAFIDDFVPLYRSTYQKYGTPALFSPALFHALRETMSDPMRFQIACPDGDLAAATMFVHSDCGLVAMHWAPRVDTGFRHLELTYYQGIKFAIECGLITLDVGPISDHNAPRGFPAMASPYAHWFADHGLARMLATGITRRTQTVRAKTAALDILSGFRRDLGCEAGPEAVDVV